MASAGLDLKDFFGSSEVPPDSTGCLAVLASFLDALEPCLVLLAYGDGELIAADNLDSALDVSIARGLARDLAIHLHDQDAYRAEIFTELGPRLCFAVGLRLNSHQGIVGGLVQSSDACWKRLGKVEATMAECGKLAWIAIQTEVELTESRVRVRHLQAEQVALKASHTEAISDAIREREERIRQQLAYDARMNAVLETAADGIIVTDDHGIIDTFNEAAQRILGYRAKEVVGTDLARLLPFLDEEGNGVGLRCRTERGNACRGGIRREVDGLRKDGTTCPLELALSTTYVDDRQILTAIVRDISERKRAEQEVRRLHAQNRMILNSVGEGIFGIDQQGFFIFVNPAGARMLGWQPEELIGKPQHTTVCHTQRDGTPYAKESSPIWTTIQDGMVRRTDTELFWRPDGTSFPVQYTCTALREGERIIGAVVTFADITERRILEAQLAQAQKLESIGQLAAGIAHEINTPTQYIGDNIRFLQDAFDELRPLLTACSAQIATGRTTAVPHDLPEEQPAAAQTPDVDFLLGEIPAAIAQSLEGVDRVAKIVRSMKEFSHPDGGEKQAIDLNRAIESTLTISRNEWKYVAEATTDFDPDLPPVTCLPGDLNQVLLNLIVNAAHAIEAKLGENADQKGMVTVRTRQDGDWVEIEVQDTGSGIADAIRSKVFDRFFTTKKMGRGTGQGLAIARAIVVERHGGTITFDTEVGRGTVFKIRLPINAQSSSCKGDADEAADPGCG
jgi:PAS domain S-box-containing protein